MWKLVVLCALIPAIQGVSKKSINNWQLPVFPQGRVVGGAGTDISQVPYQLQLEESGFQFCGASIISSKFALTAAHCTYGRTAFGLQVRYGSSYHATGGSVVQVAAIHQHPLYDQRATDYDVSVLSLRQAIPFSGSAQPVQLAMNEPSVGEYARVSGWGVIVEGISSQPFQLQSVLIPVSDRWSCNAAYENRITSRMFCAGAPNQDSCQGDSGGPLVANGVQIGIVSWGYGCARMGYPGVYSNVANLRSFIDNFTQNQARWMSTNSTT